MAPLLKLTTAGLLVLLTGAAAQAATVTETFQFGSGGVGVGTPAASFRSKAGHFVTVTAGIYDDYPTDRVESVGTVEQVASGIGVLVPCGTCGDTPLLDGNGKAGNPSADILGPLADEDFAEILTFRFGRNVTLAAITFGGFDPTVSYGTSFDLLVGGREILDTLEFSDAGWFLPAETYSGNLFAIGAWQCITGFAVTSITVRTETSEVPLPAGAVMLLSGLAGLGMVRRRGRG